MLSKKRVLILFATILVCVAGLALAKAVKVELMPYPPAAPLDPNASGHAILNYAKGQDKTIVQVNCWNLKPETGYTVYLSNGGFYSIGDFTTRKNGSGNLHVSLEGDVSADLPVAVNDTASNLTVLLGQ